MLLGGIIMLATSGTIFEATTHYSEPIADALNKAITTVQNYSSQPITTKDIQSTQGVAVALAAFGTIFTAIGFSLMRNRSYESHPAETKRIKGGK